MAYRKVVGSKKNCYLASLDNDEDIKVKKKGKNEYHQTITKKIICAITEDQKELIENMSAADRRKVVELVVDLYKQRQAMNKEKRREY